MLFNALNEQPRVRRYQYSVFRGFPFKCYWTLLILTWLFQIPCCFELETISFGFASQSFTIDSFKLFFIIPLRGLNVVMEKITCLAFVSALNKYVTCQESYFFNLTRWNNKQKFSCIFYNNPLVMNHNRVFCSRLLKLLIWQLHMYWSAILWLQLYQVKKKVIIIIFLVGEQNQDPSCFHENLPKMTSCFSHSSLLYFLFAYDIECLSFCFCSYMRSFVSMQRNTLTLAWRQQSLQNFFAENKRQVACDIFLYRVINNVLMSLFTCISMSATTFL